MKPIYLDHSATTPVHPEALAVGTVRFSLGRDNTEEEIRRAVSILKALVEKRRILAELEGSVGGRGCR